MINLAQATIYFWQVDFPERAGALARFLSVVSPAFNVTLFHYRRTGAHHHLSMWPRAWVDWVQAALHLRSDVCKMCHFMLKAGKSVLLLLFARLQHSNC